MEGKKIHSLISHAHALLRCVVGRGSLLNASGAAASLTAVQWPPRP
jgi:hypothetical protein